jgi:hypothetical protein
MKASSVQVQPGRADGMDVAAVEARFSELLLNRDLVERHHFERGIDKGST